MGALGTSHSERGLTYYEVALSGHMYVLGDLFDVLCGLLIALVLQGSAVLSEGTCSLYAEESITDTHL